MIDLKDLRAHPDDYETSAKRRGLTINISAVLKADEERVKLLQQVEGLRAKLNVSGKPTPEELKNLQSSKQELEQLEEALAKVQSDLEAKLMELPNRLADDTPEGGEEANRSERTWGEAKVKEGAKDHLALAEALDLVDFERAAKTTGAKFYFLKGAAVKLELAVVRLVFDLLESKGFTPMLVPHLVNGRVASGTGFMPRGEEHQIYKLEDEDLYLIATAELPLTGYHADEILDPKSLPRLYAGLSPAYRREAGAYGKHSKGLYRVHQFDKLELYVFCAPEDSNEWLQTLVKIEEDVAQALEIPYRVTRTAAGDMGAPHFQKYDLEYWSPIDGQYRELTSASNCTDFQARRLGIRTRDTGGQTCYVHTLNATAAAFSRIFIALLENHQTTDGQINLPEALRSYYGASHL